MGIRNGAPFMFTDFKGGQHAFMSQALFLTPTLVMCLCFSLKIRHISEEIRCNVVFIQTSELCIHTISHLHLQICQLNI